MASKKKQEIISREIISKKCSINRQNKNNHKNTKNNKKNLYINYK